MSTIKVYLQSDNAGYGILFTDGSGHWYYVDPENGIFDDIDLYQRSPLTTVKLLSDDINIIDHLSLCAAFGTRTEIIDEYDGFLHIDDVKKLCSRKCKSYDDVVWYEIPLKGGE